jgi:hypothetical protein
MHKAGYKLIYLATYVDAVEMMCSMEAAFVIQPWIATRTTTDDCRLCKRAQLGGYNSLLASLKMGIAPHFGDTLELLEDAKETCMSTIHPNENCHEKMQNTLQHTQQLYDEMLEEYGNRHATIATRPTPRPPM